MPFFFCRFQIRCAASEERDIHFFLIGTSSDKTGGLSAHSHGSESSARSEIRRALELSKQLVEQANATAAAERGRADQANATAAQANATAAQAIARAELAERMIERMAQMSDRLASALSVQGSQMNLLPRQ